MLKVKILCIYWIAFIYEKKMMVYNKIDCLCTAMYVDRCISVFLSMYVRLSVCRSGRLHLFIRPPEQKLKLK